jgi:hypothetical protein
MSPRMVWRSRPRQRSLCARHDQPICQALYWSTAISVTRPDIAPASYRGALVSHETHFRFLALTMPHMVRHPGHLDSHQTHRGLEGLAPCRRRASFLHRTANAHHGTARLSYVVRLVTERKSLRSVLRPGARLCALGPILLAPARRQPIQGAASPRSPSRRQTRATRRGHVATPVAPRRATGRHGAP